MRNELPIDCEFNFVVLVYLLEEYYTGLLLNRRIINVHVCNENVRRMRCRNI